MHDRCGWRPVASDQALRWFDSKTLRVPKEHFDLALEQCFQAEKFQICPQFCPQLHAMHSQLRALAVMLRGA